MEIKSTLLKVQIPLAAIYDLFDIIYCSAFFVFSFVAFSYQSLELLILWCLIAIIYALYLLRKKEVFRFQLDVESSYIVLLTISAIVALPFSIYNGIQNIGHFLVFLLCQFISFALSRNGRVLFWTLRISTILVQVPIIAFILNYQGMDPLSNIVPGTSCNGIPSYLIVLQCCYCIMAYVHKQSFAWVSSLLTMYICYIGVGRGSIMAGALLIFCSFTFWFASLPPPKKNLVNVIFCTGALGGLALLGDQAVSIYRRTKFAAGFGSNERIWMWTDYMQGLDFLEVLFGGNFEGGAIGEFFNGNPHNAFVRGHSKFGLAYILLVAWGPFLYFFTRERKKETLYCLLVLLIILIRAITEAILFPTIIDVYFFSVLYFLLFKERNVSAKGIYVG